MLVHPSIDPIALNLGPLHIHWYGLCYLVGFVVAFLILNYRINHYPWLQQIWRGKLDDFFFWLVLGVVVGGRLGEVLFYHPEYYLARPLEIFKVWQGGMSFHGGFIGVLLAITVWSRKYHIAWADLADLIAPTVPFGLALGRIGNFINGELWGRVADPSLPWAMIFPQLADNLPRHPSQLYQALLEGFLLFVLLMLYSRQQRPRYRLSGCFLLGYGLLRSFAEYFREPDSGIFGFSYTVSMGQWLSLPMIVLGLFLIYCSRSSAAKN